MLRDISVLEQKYKNGFRIITLANADRISAVTLFSATPPISIDSTILLGVCAFQTTYIGQATLRLHYGSGYTSFILLDGL